MSMHHYIEVVKERNPSRWEGVQDTDMKLIHAAVQEGVKTPCVLPRRVTHDAKELTVGRCFLST